MKLVYKMQAKFKKRTPTFRQELVDNDIELSVRHLKQYFKFGHGAKTKAVHDVSFDIKKGECFGLVGESGCGKTTTGRSLIRLYHITSGSIYFEGHRISAGSRWNEKEIKWTKIKSNRKIKALQNQRDFEVEKISDKTGTAEELHNINLDVININNELKDLKIRYKERLDQASNIVDEEDKALKVAEINQEYSMEVETRRKKIEDYQKRVKEIKEIRKNAKKEGDAKLSENQEMLVEQIKIKYNNEIAELKKHIDEVTKEQTEAIAQIKYDNKHVNKKVMSKMQMIFQDPVDSLDPRMTVDDIIQEGLHIQGQYNRYKNSQKVKDALIKVGLLPEYSSRYPHEFSGGQRQRIGIARALIMNPNFLICDEPISALDVSIRAQIINLLNDLKEEMGLTILFIAHDLSVVKYFCDRIAVMYYGEIVELATSDELFAHPLHPYTHALLSAIPKPDPLSEKKRKRFIYVPSKEHDYSEEAPKLVEITPGHFVLANSVELEKYRAELGIK